MKTELIKHCRYFESCDAPLCPLDPDIDKRTWFADEPICKRRKFAKQLWRKNQRKIAKVADFEAGYFTKSMLDKRMTVRKGIKGLNPDFTPSKTRRSAVKGVSKRGGF
ncbi:MAG: hypothetical protein ACYSYU_06405 [Planctomycetota bacterium]|jgi:hypothetical protein